MEGMSCNKKRKMTQGTCCSMDASPQKNMFVELHTSADQRCESAPDNSVAVKALDA